MDLLEQTKILLKKSGLKPDKLKGQNFCVNEKLLDRMVEASGLSSKDTVIEVGAGFGFLTTRLCRAAEKVVAVEMEKDLIKILNSQKHFYKNLEVVLGDILRLRAEDLLKTKKDYKIVSNLPYSITSAFLRRFLTCPWPPKDLTLLVQEEVAQRICALPGQLSLLGLSVQLYGRPSIVEKVGPGNFWPQPRVISSILKIEEITKYPYENIVPEKVFWQIVRSGFSNKRKQLHNNLKNSLHLTSEQVSKMMAAAEVEPSQRAQELSQEDWLRLAKTYHSFN